MKKVFIVFFIILGGLIIQTSGQTPPPGVPLTAKRIFLEDFSGNNSNTYYPTPITQATYDTLPRTWTTTLTFDPLQFQSGHPQNNGFTMAKNTTGAPYAVWWGNGGTTAYDDHTSPGVPGQGYMMVINSADDPTREMFHYTIGGLCPNSQLYFSAYAGNLVRSGSKRRQPRLRFVLEDPAKSNQIVQDVLMDSIPEDTAPTWHSYSTNFQSGASTAITLIIYNTCNDTNGNDLVMDDIEIWLVPPELAISSISSPSFYYCKDSPMDLAGTYEDPYESFEGHAEFMWLYSQYEDFRDSTFVSSDSVCREPAKAGWYKVVIGAEGNTYPATPGGPTYNNTCCTVSQPVEVKMIPPSTVLYWNPNATNQNWNDYNNWWLTPSGSPSPYPPSSCTDVHIPGNATNYPALATNISGTPSKSHYIYFHFGGLIGQPHLLQYDSAYVQYNFGKSSGANGDTYSPAAPMSRDRYYALAAPLQKMVSGDFAFGGFPMTWQKSFKTSLNQTTGTINTGELNGDFFYPDSTNDWKIFAQYNAIVIYVDGDLTNQYVTGSYQNNLDHLNGILEVPYYNDAANLQYHRVEQAGNVSSFPYFDYKSMNFLDADRAIYPPGTIDRGAGNAYHFIFQDNTLFTPDGSKYKMLNIPAGKDILVGNPFMSNFDFNAFVEDNPTTGIDIYSVYNGSSYESYSYTAGSTNPLRYIAPLQSFIINTGSATSLIFDADREALATTPPAAKLRASADDNTKPDVLYFKAESKAGVSYLTLSMQNVKKKNMNLIWPRDWSDSLQAFVDAYPNAPRLYATDDSGQKNSIQFEGGYVDQVPLGILSSGSDQVTLTVYNKDKVNANYMVLWDKTLDKKIDLKTTDTYTFTNVPTVQDRFVLMFSNKSITGISPVEAAHPVNVSALDKTLYVSSAIGIEAISVITLQGITVMKENNIGQTTCSKSLQVPPGLYIVSVKLKTGETSVAKIVIK